MIPDNDERNSSLPQNNSGMIPQPSKHHNKKQSENRFNMSGVGESRSELLSWLNDLLKLNYKKIEECGTGAAYCQIMDSIYGDIPMHRVKFNATAEYEFSTNFKVLQSCFTRHKIEKTVYVEKLVRCRFQDNLEFLQWIKRFWAQNKDESEYDAEARRKNRPTSIGSSGTSNVNIAKRRSLATGSSVTPITNGTRSTRSSLNGLSRNSSSYGTATRRISNEQLLTTQAELAQAQKKIDTMNKEMNQYQEAMTVMERERDFYFGKLRDIEILVQSTNDLVKEGVYNNDPNELGRFLGKVQQILYATEDGFEVSNDSIGEERNDGMMEVDSNLIEAAVIGNKPQPTHNLITDEETF